MELNLSILNKPQLEAVKHTEGPLLILAGAGSGKTRVLTFRIAYLIEQGVMPWQILAITFTNKAAGEMRERVDALLGGQGADVFVSTFHSMCVRILRRNIDRLGYERDFTIYDADDQRTLMKQVIKNLSLDAKMYKERAVLGVISSAKNEMRDPELFAGDASDYYERNIARIYEAYEKEIKKNNALDFDDLLLKTVELFKEFPEVLAGYQERFRYIMVDEYQDTNTVQFELVRLMSGKYRNLCVVGDDDQSIYKFRGANIENILSFERSFPGAHVIKLEQNYRSTKQILAAANEVIHNNRGRKEKKLWTENAEGETPQFKEYETAGAEAEAIVREADSCGLPLRDQAVLYRTNAQSRLLEEKCIQYNVPYIIVGGVNFYQRREIKDVLSYLRVTANGVDDLACERILNVPKRGIGQTTVERVHGYAVQHGKSLFDALLDAERGLVPGVGGMTAKKIGGFTSLIGKLREKASDPKMGLRELITAVRDDTGYAEELKKEGEIEAETRIENIDELIAKAVSYEETSAGKQSRSTAGSPEAAGAAGAPEAAGSSEAVGSSEAASSSEAVGSSEMASSSEAAGAGLETLSAFLEEVSLLSDIDRKNDADDVLTMMTLHAAKGLEFDKVYLCGMEDGLFPSASAINSDNPAEEIEEERRLCYVGITRARKVLRLTAARERMIHGETRYEKPSRFIDELSDGCCEKEFLYRRKTDWKDYDDDFERAVPRRGFGGDGYGSRESGFYGDRSDIPFAASGHAGNSFGKGGNVYSAYSEKTQAVAPGDFSSVGGFRTARFGNFGSLDTTRTGGRSGRKQVPSLTKGSAMQKQKPDYAAGDRVRHIKFGDGTVQEIKDEPRDYLVTVLFDEAGVKKMYAGFARLEKI